MMNLSQTKLVGLTMELDLKAREYKILCDKFEKLNEKNINPNDERLLEVKGLFQKNHDEIVEINRKIKEIKETEELIEKQKMEKYETSNLFKRNNDTSKEEKQSNVDVLVVETKENLITKLIKKVEEFFSKNNK